MVRHSGGSRQVCLWTLSVVAFIFVGLFSSCGGQSGSSEGASADSGEQFVLDSSQQKLNITKSNQDSLIVATVTAGSIPDSIVLQITHDFQRVHLVIKQIKDVDSLVATLRAPGSQRNLRFNQVIMPDGLMDGPFGHQLHYPTKQNGDYTLIIGKDNMADGMVQGPAVIHLQLQ